MARAPISNLVRQQLLQRVADPVTGLNPLYQQAIVEYGLKMDQQKFPMDFGPKSRQVIFGNTNPLTQEQTTSFVYPFISIYSHGIINRNYRKFTKFSGDVVMGLDFWLSWASTKTLTDFESFGDAAEEAIVEIVNGMGSDLGAKEQNWGPLVVYNGGVSCSRTDLALAAENWLQGLKFRITFEMDVDQ